MSVLCEEYQISAATLYAGRKLYSDLPAAVVAKIQTLSITNSRLERRVRDLESDNRALQHALLRHTMTPRQRRELVTYLTRCLGMTHTKACKYANISRSFFAYEDQMHQSTAARNEEREPPLVRGPAASP